MPTANCRTKRCPRRLRCAKCNADRARQARKTLAKYYARRAAIIAMLGSKCSECDAVENLEIDHIDQTQKSFYISKCMTISIVKLHEEAKKCRLLCVNHHKKTPSYGRWRSKAGSVPAVEATEVYVESGCAEGYVESQDIEF